MFTLITPLLNYIGFCVPWFDVLAFVRICYRTLQSYKGIADQMNNNIIIYWNKNYAELRGTAPGANIPTITFLPISKGPPDSPKMGIFKNYIFCLFSIVILNLFAKKICLYDQNCDIWPLGPFLPILKGPHTHHKGTFS